MKIRSLDRYKPILTALKKAGYKTIEVAEQNKKTIITISPVELRAAPKVNTQ